MTNWFRTAPTVGIDDYKRQRGESKLIALKDARIMQLLEQIEDLECSKRQTRKATATDCLEIISKHDCQSAADEIRRKFGISD